MANPIKNTAFASRSTVLTTGLNSLAAATQSAAGSAIDNSANLDAQGKAVISLTYNVGPSDGASVTLWAISAPDGTNYCDAVSAIPLAVVPVALGTSAQLLETPMFDLPPGKVKFLLTNNGDQALVSSGNTVTLYTTYPQVN